MSLPGNEGMNLSVWDLGINPSGPANNLPLKPDEKIRKKSEPQTLSREIVTRVNNLAPRASTREVTLRPCSKRNRFWLDGEAISHSAGGSAPSDRSNLD